MDFNNLTDKEKRHLRGILISLSHRESQCFLLNTVRLMSFQQIADELKISRSSVQKYIERAREKIKKYNEKEVFM